MTELQTWIPLVITLVTLAATWGDVRARLRAVEKLAARVSTDLEKSRGGQGGRIGDLSERLARVEGILNLSRPRATTRGGGIPLARPTDDESGVDE